MATIQVRDIPEEVAEILRRRAEVAGMSLQAYMRQQLIQFAHQRSKAEIMEVVRQNLERDPSPGMTMDEIVAELHELRGE